MGAGASTEPSATAGGGHAGVGAGADVPLETWLSSYPAHGGPRPDQFGAFEWFKNNGWVSKWPLHHAAMVGDASKITSLMRSGRHPDEEMTDWYDSSPLGWAASFGQLSCVIALIQGGANPSPPANKAGYTPLTDAQREHHGHVVKFLQELDKRKKAQRAGGSRPAGRSKGGNDDKNSLAKKFGTELYHQTNEDIANKILSTQTMKPGSKGLAGGGIYFATTKELTGHKAHAHGVILKAYVRLGRILTLKAEGDTAMTAEKLRSQGFDSVCIARKVESGHEYVVYDPEQVLLIERA